MNFSVIWRPTALNELATIWTEVSDRAAITLAADEIDRILEMDPHTGESRMGTQRVAYVFPLGVRFEIILDDLKVNVLAVWLTRMV